MPAWCSGIQYWYSSQLIMSRLWFCCSLKYGNIKRTWQMVGSLIGLCRYYCRLLPKGFDRKLPCCDKYDTTQQSADIIFRLLVSFSTILFCIYILLYHCLQTSYCNAYLRKERYGFYESIIYLHSMLRMIILDIRYYSTCFANEKMKYFTLEAQLYLRVSHFLTVLLCTIIDTMLDNLIHKYHTGP